jgi:hypothetical protein
VNRRIVMSSSMRRRSGLMGFSLIGGSRLEGGVFDPSILKTECTHRHLRSINMVSASTAHSQQPCHPLPR